MAAAGAKQPYKAAAQAGQSVRTNLVGMMRTTGFLRGKPVVTHFDPGCNVSTISAAEVRAKPHIYQAGKTQLVQLKAPVRVGLFAGNERYGADYMLLDVPLGLGRGVYPVNLLVLENSNYGLTLGNDFNWAYGVTFHSRSPTDRTVGRQVVLPLTPDLLAPGEEMPKRPKSAGPSWRALNYVKTDYDVVTEDWRCSAVDSLPAQA